MGDTDVRVGRRRVFSAPLQGSTVSTSGKNNPVSPCEGSSDSNPFGDGQLQLGRVLINRPPVSAFGAGSTGRCNTGVKSLCWGFECQGLPWPFV